MRFLYKKFQAKKKEIVEVRIDRRTKVRFMTAVDFKRYKNGRSFNFFGGTFETSPVLFVLPYDSVWHVVVEKGTHYNPIDMNAQCRILPPDRQVLSSVALDAPAHVREAEEQAQIMMDSAEAPVRGEEEGDRN
jgi:hypothetical protein